MAEPKKRWVSSKEVAQTMGVTPRAVRAWVGDGRYKTKRTGGGPAQPGHHRIEVDEDGWPIETTPEKR